MKTKIKPLGKITKTSRGFPIIEFKDRYDEKCSLQMSSLADYAKPGTSAVWLGLDDVKPMCLHGDAKALGIKTEAICGWVEYPLPKKVHLMSRMHLDRPKVESLIAHLQSWLKRDTFKI